MIILQVNFIVKWEFKEHPHYKNINLQKDN